MNAYFLFGITSVLGIFSTVLNKRFQQGLTMDMPHFVMYNFVNSAFGSIAFLFMMGGKFEMNTITFIYSIVYAILVFVSLIVNVLFLSCMPIFLQAISAKAGTMLVSVFGILFFKEVLTPQLAISLILLFISSFLPYFGKSGVKLNAKKLAIILSYVIVSASSVIIPKMYADNPDVCSSQSFFFATNLLLACVSGIILIFIKKPEGTSIFKLFTLKQTGSIASRTLISNISAVLQVSILSVMSISTYTVMSSAFGLVSNALLAKYFKEKISFVSWLALILGVAAVAVNP